MKNVILTDFLPCKDWNFAELLSKYSGHTFEVMGCKANGEISKPRRLMLYFSFPWKVFRQRRSLQNIVAWQQFYGLIFAFYCRLFHVRKTARLTVLTFIYKPKRRFAGKVYEWFMKSITHSIYIDKLVVFSKNEIQYYSNLLGIPENKLAFIPYYQEKIPLQTDSMSESGGYILSTGGSNRDYEFLYHALNGTSYKVEIICHGYQLPGQSDNISVRHNIFTYEMRNYMRNCYCVVIPLKDLNISSGQLVLLQAMMLKKPIIITKSRGVSDYIVDGYNGLMIENTKEQLLNALDKLYRDSNLYDRLVQNGYTHVNEKFGIEAFAKNISELL